MIVVYRDSIDDAHTVSVSSIVFNGNGAYCVLSTTDKPCWFIPTSSILNIFEEHES